MPAVAVPVSDQKSALREDLARRLEAVSPAQAARAAAACAERFLALPAVASARRLLVCLSFGTEISTAPAIARLQAADRQLYVPRADPRDGQIHVHPYPCELVELGFGLRQPPRGAPEVPSSEIDATLGAALVLGLGFDEDGYRLGHGRGYFDRFLAGRRFPAIGFAYELQVVPRLPREPHDVPMAALVTEASTRHIRSRGV
jgi:5-formyltetrahydrofolate cyclo-ligase